MKAQWKYPVSNQLEPECVVLAEGRVRSFSNKCESSLWHIFMESQYCIYQYVLYVCVCVEQRPWGAEGVSEVEHPGPIWNHRHFGPLPPASNKTRDREKAHINIDNTTHTFLWNKLELVSYEDRIVRNPVCPQAGGFLGSFLLEGVSHPWHIWSSLRVTALVSSLCRQRGVKFTQSYTIIRVWILSGLWICKCLWEVWIGFFL